jgi:hypothetical protein
LCLAARAVVAASFAVNALDEFQVLSEPFDTSGRTGVGLFARTQRERRHSSKRLATNPPYFAINSAGTVCSGFMLSSKLLARASN